MNTNKKCKYCGAPAISKFFIGKKGCYYCSYECACLDTRVENSVGGVFLFFIGLILLITGLSIKVYLPFIAMMVACLIGGLIVLSAGIKGQKEFNRRNRNLIEKVVVNKNFKISNIPQQLLGPWNYSKSAGSLLCIICKIKIKEPEEYYQCPHCLSVFHTNHLTEWLTIKKECPVCKRKFF